MSEYANIRELFIQARARVEDAPTRAKRLDKARDYFDAVMGDMIREAQAEAVADALDRVRALLTPEGYSISPDDLRRALEGDNG